MKTIFVSGITYGSNFSLERKILCEYQFSEDT